MRNNDTKRKRRKAVAEAAAATKVLDPSSSSRYQHFFRIEVKKRRISYLLVFASIALGAAVQQANMLMLLLSSEDDDASTNAAVLLDELAAPRGFFVKSQIAFTHIPKCSGTSFREMMQPAFAEQDCYRHMRRVNGMNVVFFRSPRKHVQSQFLECTYDEAWGVKVTNKTNFPRGGNGPNKDMNNFQLWLEHFVALPVDAIGGEHDFRCFDPRDLQTRHMSCEVAPNPEANHALSPPPDIDLALVNLRHASFVGLTDFFHESICALKLRRDRILPANCRCDSEHVDEKAVLEATVSEVHIRHGVPPHSSVFPDQVATMIDKLTRLDRILFVAALERFLDDIDLAEKVANRQFLCNRTRATELLELYRE